MFAGGIIPGLLIAAALMIIIAIRAPGQNLPVSGERPTLKNICFTFKRAFFPLLTPVLLIGGIVGGFFTPTEAAAVAAFYSMILGLFYTKEIKFSDLPKIFSKTALSSAVILMLVGAAVAFASVISLKGTPQLVTEMVLGITDNVYLMFFIINVLLLGVGCLVDAGPAILMLAPILAPLMIGMGIHPVHFGLVMSINMILGLLTPPMGLVLFVVSGISREKVEIIAKEMMPLFLGEIAVLFFITYVPETCLFLPRLMGYIQ
jgi:tripartite ATP-independent transporter DctM subunit